MYVPFLLISWFFNNRALFFKVIFKLGEDGSFGAKMLGMALHKFPLAWIMSTSRKFMVLEKFLELELKLQTDFSLQTFKFIHTREQNLTAKACFEL